MGSQWPAVFPFLREELLAAGAVEAGGGEGHLTAVFGDPPAGLSAVIALVRGAGSRFGRSSGPGALPLQAVLHLAPRAQAPLPLLDSSSRVWRLLPLDGLHATEALRRAWDRLAAGTDLLGAAFSPAALGLYRLGVPGGAPRRELLPDRALPYLWGEAECFYCGLTNHPAASCPSRQLTIDVHGLSELGHLPPAELPEVYRRAMGDPEELARRVAGGISPAQVRRDPLLAVSAAYFDVHRIHQLRFLIHLAFADGSRWPGIRSQHRGRAAAGSGLFLALDCLRVGKHAEAQAILTDKRRVRDADRFYAQVALAFLALEEGRPRDMAVTLDRAARLASNREERLYAALLASRCRELLGDLDGAQAAADRAVELRPDCPEGQYRRAQLLMRGGSTPNAVTRICALAQGDPDYYALALLDPQLYPGGAAVDEALAQIHDVASKAAAEILVRTRRQCEDLSGWLDAGDADLTTNLGMLARLEEQVARQGYADLLDAAARGGGLSAACSQVRKRKLKELRAALEGQQGRWAVLRRVWKGYPHKMLFRLFGTLLGGARRKLDEALPLARSENLSSYRTARGLLEGTRKDLDEMESMVRDMIWTQDVVAFFGRFLARLALGEAILAPLVFLGLPVAARCLGGEAGRALGDPVARHRAFVVLGGLVAPALAVARAAKRKGPVVPVPSDGARNP